jgi:hypothetical protein
MFQVNNWVQPRRVLPMRKTGNPLTYPIIGRVVAVTAEGYTVEFEDGTTVEKLCADDLEPIVVRHQDGS